LDIELYHFIKNLIPVRENFNNLSAFSKVIGKNTVTPFSGHGVKRLALVSDVVEKTSTRRRSRIPCVVVEKITTSRREGVGVVVEKIKKVDELSTKILAIYLQR